jgi:hypothetical protein
MLVSSAYRMMLVLFMGTLVISFMYKRKKSGPWIDPCGTPNLTSAQLDKEHSAELLVSRFTL